MTANHAAVRPSMADIYRPEYIADPYPLYRSIREISPVYWDERGGENGAWMITGFEPALAALTDRRLSARRPQWDPHGHPPEHAKPLGALSNQVFVLDPPRHTVIRKLLSKPFLPRAVEQMRAHVERAADRLLDRVVDRGEMEAMGDFALALPGAIVSSVLGVPFEDQPIIWRRILSWGLVVDGGPLSRQNPDYHLGNISKYMDYFRAQLAKRRDQRTDDLMQALADSWGENAWESEEELLGNLIFMLTAGQTTTAHQIGNTILALMAFPEVHRRMVADPSAVPAATPEFMRYDSSVQLTKRRAREPVELGGQRIEPGQEIFVWMGAAHRDPAAFPDPDVLDPDRPKTQNLSLGHGIHYCLGGQLGQLVNEVAITRFVERIRNPRVDLDKVERAATPTFRGPHKLPLHFG